MLSWCTLAAAGFFEEISRPEGVQILRYASRALELAGEVAGIHLKNEFIQRFS